MDQDNRVVVLVDMDCFYCQVEEKLNPELAGKPIAVVQYNPWKGGGIIAVNYVARAMGVTRHMRGDEAKEKCPEIQLPSVPCQRGKADITKYRDAGKEVVKVLQKYTPLLERASIDEAYLDITAAVQERRNTQNVNTITSNIMPNTYALGYEGLAEFVTDVHNCSSDSIEFDYDHAKRLLVGAVIVSEMRAAVYEETGYRCSAGIAHNKILAKLVCGMNKPNKQTILPKHAVDILYKTWLYNMARGINLEPVQARINAKSIGCCKQLRGKSALTNLDSLRKWLRDLGDEIEDRLEKDALENNRTPRQMVVSFTTQLPNGQDASSSRSYNFMPDDELCGELFFSKALDLLMESAEGVKVKDGEENRKLKAPITFLGISVGKFEDTTESKKVKKIKDYFNAGASKQTVSKESAKESKKDNNKKNNVKSEGKEYVLQKFFRTSNVQNKTKDEDLKEIQLNQEQPMETTLDKQESFFAKFLTGNTTTAVQSGINPNHIDTVQNDSAINRSTTHVCNVIPCGDDTNDTDYSGSTINMEINKSIALFEDDAEEVARVSSIRELLNSSNLIETENTHQTSDAVEEVNRKETPLNTNEYNLISETIVCPECRKPISIHMLDEHSDYHMALKLRNEERQLVRQEREKTKEINANLNQSEVNATKESSKKGRVSEELPVDKLPSIANFLVKIDDTIPTNKCEECGKKVPVEKYTEHLDFHEAQKLSRLLNNKSNPVFLTGSSTKRKRKSTSPVKKPKVLCKSIDLFFR
ncbi:DNA polymerase eta isoform X2 [Epargyreus clarus]|uniref:DNA polymerase eta isoform X2 n=1 Tax=Epargyreus clarus TaxID=520877 RepID=UPI003C2F3D5B